MLPDQSALGSGIRSSSCTSFRSSRARGGQEQVLVLTNGDVSHSTNMKNPSLSLKSQ